MRIGDEVRAVGLGVDGARQRCLQFRERRPASGCVVGSQGDGQVLECRNGFDDLEGKAAVVLDPQACGAAGQVQRPVGGRRTRRAVASGGRLVGGPLLRAGQPGQCLVEGPADGAPEPPAWLLVRQLLLERRCRLSELTKRVLDVHDRSLGCCQ
jgi:hypothetical protein